MANLNGFNANDVEPQAAFEALPAGKYMAIITDSQTKPTKAGTGSYLELTFQVVEGEYKGRLLWARLCLNHPNAMTVQIARGQLSAICRATGVMQPKDSVELHNLPLQISVTCKKREDTGEIGNEIKSYSRKPLAGGAPAQQTSGTPPWKRG